MTTTEARNGRATTAILLAQGHLREGVAASLTGFVYRNNGHIVYHDQYVDREKQRYFARLEWSLPGVAVPREEIGERLASVAEPFGCSGDCISQTTTAAWPFSPRSCPTAFTTFWPATSLYEG